MELNSPVLQTIIGLVVFYIVLKMFSGGMKSMGKLEHLEVFIHNPYWMFFGGIVCTILWQSSSLSTTAIIGLVASGALPLPSAIAAVLGANIGEIIRLINNLNFNTGRCSTGRRYYEVIID